MSGNTFGKLFTLTACGESHGKGYLGIIDGCPPGLALSEVDLQEDLNRRKPGQSRYVTQRKESDQVTIFSGVFEGYTVGTPIGLLIQNEDQKSQDYSEIAERFRPGHADYTYHKKYGRRDYRGGGRASARETCMRVAAGAIAKKYLTEHCGVQIDGYLAQLGKIVIPDETQGKTWDQARKIIKTNDFFSPNPDIIADLEDYINRIRKAGDSIGACVKVIADGVPTGLGEPIFDRLDADIAKAMMSINAVKGVEIGAGFASVVQTGSVHRDEITANGFLSNHAGGVLGGISSGQRVEVSIALKPTSSIRLPAKTLNHAGEEVEVAIKGRHDPCVGIRAVPIAEAMLAIVLMDHFLRYRGQCGTDTS